MKKISVLFFLMIALVYNSKAHYLVRIQFNFKKLIGHGVDMKFAIHDLSEVQKFLLNIDTITENKMLTGLGVPLIPDYLEDSCKIPHNVKFDYTKLFGHRRSFTMATNNENIDVKINILKCDYVICVENVYSRIFGDYSVQYTKVGTIISNPTIKYFNKTDKVEIRNIYVVFSKLNKLPVKFLNSVMW